MTQQPATAPSIWERSNIVRALRWLWNRRRILRAVLVLAWILTIAGLWYGEENWRGRRAWNQYRQAAEARGESFDYATYIPKAVPEDQNFAATPFLKSFLLQPNDPILTNDLYARAASHISEAGLLHQRGRRHLVDLVAWQMASAALQNGPWQNDKKFETDETNLAQRAAAAPAVLEGLKPDQAAFAELRAASAREFSRYPLNYDSENPCAILLPHLAKVKAVCQRLSLEACADLAAGQSGPALADVKLILSLADSVQTEPFLISSLVRMACVQIAIQPVWEGLAEHRWTEAQLQELQARFLSRDFLADLQQPLRAEGAFGCVLADLAKKLGMQVLDDFPDRQQDRSFYQAAFYLLGRVMPAGWYCQEKLHYCTLFDAQRKVVVDLAAKTVSPSKAASNAEELNEKLAGMASGTGFNALLHHCTVAAMLLPSFGNISRPFASAQTAADQAALACALERYHLAQGQFPGRLAALTPQFISRLPNDVITGRPYKYRPVDDGQFILYSVGWNEKDDGGTPGHALFDTTQGDWVWSYPAK